MLHVQGAFQLVVEAAAARAGATFNENLRGRYPVARVTVQAKQQQQ